MNILKAETQRGRKIALFSAVLLFTGVVVSGVAYKTTHAAKALTMDEILSNQTGQVLSAASKTKHIKLSSIDVKKVPSVKLTVVSPFGGTVLSSQVLTPDATGTYTVTVNNQTSIPNNILLRVQPQGYLSRLVPNVDLTDPTTQIIALDFTPGDVNGDNVIDSLDKAAIKTMWTSSNPSGDLNHDGMVNSLDMATVIRNQGQQGE